MHGIARLTQPGRRLLGRESRSRLIAPSSESSFSRRRRTAQTDGRAGMSSPSRSARTTISSTRQPRSPRASIARIPTGVPSARTGDMRGGPGGRAASAAARTARARPSRTATGPGPARPGRDRHGGSRAGRDPQTNSGRVERRGEPPVEARRGIGRGLPHEPIEVAGTVGGARAEGSQQAEEECRRDRIARAHAQEDADARHVVAVRPLLGEHLDEPGMVEQPLKTHARRPPARRSRVARSTASMNSAVSARSM